jgi:hypothetical protein
LKFGEIEAGRFKIAFPALVWPTQLPADSPVNAGDFHARRAARRPWENQREVAGIFRLAPPLDNQSLELTAKYDTPGEVDRAPA